MENPAGTEAARKASSIIIPEPATARAAVFKKSLLFCIRINGKVRIIRIGERCIYLFLFIDIWQETYGKKQTFRIAIIIIAVFRIEAVDMHIPQSMDESFASQIDADMRNIFVGLIRRPSPKEYQVSPLHIRKIGKNLDTPPDSGLLKGVSGNNNIVHEQDGADKAAAIHPFRRGTRPQIRNPHHGVSSPDDAFRILLHPCPPLRFGL